MKQGKFRTAKEMDSKSERKPVSARIKVGTLETLKKEAKSGKLALAELIANVLDDYVEWLQSRKG